MNEIAVKELTLEQLGGEVRLLVRQARTMALGYGVEIGRRLAAAKEKVEYGKWGEWLENETDFSQSTAGRFIRLFEEYGAKQGSLFGAEVDSSTLTNLSISNALRLIAVPEEERESFAQEVDAEHLSARELEEAIKARDTAKAELERVMGEVSDAHDREDELAVELEKAQKALKAERSKPVEVAVQKPSPEEIRAEAEKIAAEGIAAAEAREKAARERMEAELAEAEKKLAEAVKLRDKAILESANAGEADKLRKEAEQARMEAEELRKKLAASDGTVQAVNAYIQSGMQSFTAALGLIGKTEGELRGKLGNAARALAGKLTEMAAAL